MNDEVGFFMRLVEQFDLLSAEEEHDLAVKIQQGCEVSKEKLVKANLRLVVKIAHEYKGKGVPLMDLIQQGNMGLMVASDKYILGKGTKFSSYASLWIKQRIRKYIDNNQSIVNIPTKSKKNIRAMRDAIQRLTETLRREPSIGEIANEIEQSTTTVRHLMPFYQYGEIYLDATSNTTGDDTVCFGEFYLYEMLHGEGTFVDKIDQQEQFREVRRVLEDSDNFDFRDQLIIKKRYGLTEDGEKYTLQEVAEELGISRERVRQVEHDMLIALRVLIVKKLM
jgi:RNA polymerase primary sigma factor